MATKAPATKTKSYLVNIKLAGEVNYRVSADSFEDALSKVGGLTFSDFTGDNVEDICDFKDLEVSGIFLDN